MKFFSTLLLAFFFVFSYSQVQVGQDINGINANDELGTSVSMPNPHTIAVGSPKNDFIGNDAGLVQIFEFDGTSWVQKGANLYGEAAGDNFGYSVSMPDENTVAIGAPFSNSSKTNAGKVQIFEWNSGSLSWQKRGSDIVGQEGSEQFGFSISMPDSNTICIGAPFRSPPSTGNTSSGGISIFKWNGLDWIQKGLNIQGSGHGGFSVSMSDSNTVAFSSPKFVNNKGQCKIFSWNGTAWLPKGSALVGDAYAIYSGWAIDMPDSNTIAIGAVASDAPHPSNDINVGQVKVFQWTNSTWIQKGSSLYGDSSNFNFGRSISMVDSNIMAIGADNYTGANGLGSGAVYTFEWDNGLWSLLAGTIIGDSSYGGFGKSVSMPNAYFVGVGADRNDDNGTNAGQASVWQLCDSILITNTITACDSYTWIDGNTYAASTSSPFITLTAANGCDSTIMLDLTINESSTTTEVRSACDSLTWINGITYFSSTSSPFVVLSNINGCDSTVYLDLTIEQSSTNVQSVTACDSYTWIDGNTYAASTSSPFITLTAANGCDSTIMLDLTINESSTTTEVRSVCDSLTWINGITYFSSTSSPFVVLSNINGCDSTVYLDLTIEQSSTNVQSVTACDSYTWIDGNTYAASTSSPFITLTAANGCDSTIMLDLTINTTSSSSVSISACNPFQINGQLINSSGAYTQILTNSQGCDSLLSIFAIIQSNNIIQLQPSDIAVQLGQDATFNLAAPLNSSFQWQTDLGVGFQNLNNTFQYSGVTTSTLTVSNTTLTNNNQSFRCLVFEDDCIDTSDVIILSVYDNTSNEELSNSIQIYPNPTHGFLTLKTNFSDYYFSIHDVVGNLLFSDQVKSFEKKLDLTQYSSGIYLISIEKKKYVIKQRKIIIN